MIDGVEPLLDSKTNLGVIRLRLAAIRIAAQELVDELAKSRAAHEKSNADNQKIIRQKRKHISQIAKLVDKANSDN
jgi:hypothetical protein